LIELGYGTKLAPMHLGLADRPFVPQDCHLSSLFKDDSVVQNIFKEVGQSESLVWKRSYVYELAFDPEEGGKFLLRNFAVHRPEYALRTPELT
jgi:hypothetical protein